MNAFFKNSIKLLLIWLACIQLKLYTNAIHASIGKYWFVSQNCGIGRESQLMDSTCFDYHTTSEHMDMIRLGRPARIGEFPWLVGHYIGYDSCTATIINPWWAIGCAHCALTKRDSGADVSHLTSPQPSLIPTNHEIYIPPKEHYGLNRSQERYAIDYGFIHPMYTKWGQKRYDIALFRLRKPINMSVVTSKQFTDINGVCFPSKWAFNIKYEHALIVGLGAIGNTIYNATSHGDVWTGWTRIYPINVGARSNMDDWGQIIRARRLVKEGSQSPCSGDSGSPLIQYVNGKAVIVGINYGTIPDVRGHKTECTTDDHKAVSIFARVSYFIDWINKTIAFGDKLNGKN